MVSWPERPALVRVPATSANLGPGFDALGLALCLYDRVEARVTGGGLAIEVSGEGQATASAGERHLVVRAMRAAFSVLGGQPPGLALRCENAIPHGRGLGSSAGAIVAGLLAARALARDGEAALPDDRLYRLAAALEGHPDNVAACLAGGLTIAWATRPGDYRLVSLPVADGVAAVACVPPDPLATEEARRVLPPAIPHADAAAAAGRSALLVAALTRDPRLLLDATEDYLHQRYRAAVMPHTASLVAKLRAAGVAAVVSGAGPGVLALDGTAGRGAGGGENGCGGGLAAVDSIAAETGIAWRVIPLDIDRYGATVQPPWAGAHQPASARRVRSWNPQAPAPRARSAGQSPQDDAASA
jgi:homoserine kinase